MKLSPSKVLVLSPIITTRISIFGLLSSLNAGSSRQTLLQLCYGGSDPSSIQISSPLDRNWRSYHIFTVIVEILGAEGIKSHFQSFCHNSTTIWIQTFILQGLLIGTLGKRFVTFQLILKFDTRKSLVPSLKSKWLLLLESIFHCGVNISVSLRIQEPIQSSFESSLHQLQESILILIKQSLRRTLVWVEFWLLRKRLIPLFSITTNLIYQLRPVISQQPDWLRQRLASHSTRLKTNFWYLCLLLPDSIELRRYTDRRLHLFVCIA